MLSTSHMHCPGMSANMHVRIHSCIGSACVLYIYKASLDVAECFVGSSAYILYIVHVY